MRLFYRILILLIISIPVFEKAGAQLVITNESSAQALLQKLLGQGVTVSNVGLRGHPLMTGFFNNLGGTSVGIDSGIVLTNGRAQTDGGGIGMDLIGTNTAINMNAHNQWGLPGDAALSVIVGDQTNDACVLEFDFVPLGDSIKFNYVFSSEEYPDFTCTQFNDAFGFFINGPGIPGIVNIALIPGTPIPVTINNINDQFCSLFPQYYVNNEANRRFTHNGHTVVFTASAKVIPCETYHLRLVIVDVSDDDFDSGVFLEAGSLSSNAVSIQNTTQVDQQNNSYLVEGCATGSFKIKRPKIEPGPLSISLVYTGTATNGVDMQMLPASVIIPANQSEVVVNVIPIIDNMPEGIETIKVYALAGCGSVPSDSTTIQIRDYDTLGIAPDTAIICRNTSIQLTATGGYSVYQWDPNPELSNTGIRNPVASPLNATATYYCTATEGTCHGRDSSLVILKMLDFVSKKEVNCKDATTGEIRVMGGGEWAAPVEYSINNNPYQADSTFINLPVGTYTVRIRDAAGCIDSMIINITQLFPDLLISGIPITPAGCTGTADGRATVNVVGGKAPYAYSTDGINFQASNVLNLVQGNYTVTVRDDNNCIITQNIFMPLNNVITLDAGPDATICEGKSKQLFAAATFTLEYNWTPAASLNDNTVPDPVASPVVTTKYYVTAINGICTKLDSVTVFVNAAPKANAGPDHAICFGENIMLSGSGGISYFWTPQTFLDNNRIASPTAIKPTASISYFLNVIDGNGCGSLIRDTAVITVTRPAIVNAGRDTVLAIGQPLTLFARDVNNIGFTQYEWTPDYGLNDATIFNPLAILDRDIIYTVTARSPLGCVGTDDIRIKVYRGPDIYVPKAFTPNGDNLHDVLRAIPVGIMSFHYFRIYDRWGGNIFSTTNALNGWDGRIKGVQQPTGTFVWMAEGLDYKGNIVQRKGTFVIVK